MTGWRDSGRMLASPAILHYVLPLLMFYLVAGTVSQRYIGLYEATRIFFSTPILWLGPLPLPGLPILMLLLCASLLAKLTMASPWSLRNSGIIITHLGAAFLLSGGFLTALSASEGYIDLAPGEKRDYVSDYHARELVVSGEDGESVAAFRFGSLEAGKGLPLPEGFPEISVLSSCKNCEIVARESGSESLRGMAQHMRLNPVTLQAKDEDNFSGVEVRISGAETEEENGTYVLLEGVPVLPEVSAGGRVYHLALRRKRSSLPFSVELVDFRREMHPGTDLPKSYESRVRILDGTLAWESLIRMNEPLRYKGYTLYQASFAQTPSGEVSVLAVVQNAGRTFPYVAGLLMSLGLLLHLILRRFGRVSEPK